MNKPYFVGISGGSASGKTFLLKKLLNHFSSEEITLVSQDNYYFDREELPKNERGEINFDHPDAIDLLTQKKDIERLAKGETVEIREYTFNNPAKEPKMIVYNPSPIILVEGLFVFYNEELAKNFDLRIFVDADEHIKLSRRIKRDFSERGYNLEEVLYYYEEYVIPMYKKYVEPFKEGCDIILPNNRHMDKAVSVMIHHLEKMIGR